MKKNRGDISNIKKAKEAKFQPRRWHDSSANSKWLCLNCFKCFKKHGVCCGYELTYVHKDARPPKKTASKSKWKQFFNLFLNGYSANKKQLKRIISLRKEYKLPTIKQERQLTELEVKHEEIFKLFDIKKHEALYISTEKDFKYKDIINELDTLIRNYKTIKELKHNKEYFIVPIIRRNSYSLHLPQELKYYNIYKSRGYKVQQDYEFHIKTDNSKEIISLNYYKGYYEDTQYSYKMKFMYFEKRMDAINFRREYLTLLTPVFNVYIPTINTKLNNMLDVDYSRVYKKHPELLI